MSTQQPEALAQECADYATSLRSAANVAKLEGRAPPVSFLRAADLFERAASRLAKIESQLAQRFDAADMATASASGFRDGAASAALASAPAQAAEPSITLDFKMATDLLGMFCGEPGLVTLQRGDEHCHSGPGLYAWYSDMPEEGAGFLGAEPDDEATPSAPSAPAQPAAQQGAAYAALPTSNYAGRVYEEGFLIGTRQLYTADQLRAFADATHTLRASHGQAPASVLHLVNSAFAEIAMAFPKAFALHKVGIADTAVREALAAPAPPPECETEAEKRAFAFGWFKALESERMKTDNRKKDPL